MIFIRKALDRKLEGCSVIDMINDRIAGYRSQRTHKVVHISDLSSETRFCPREFALLDATCKKPKGQYLSAAMRVTFDNGDALSDLCRNAWLEWDVVGNWECIYCHTIIEFAKKPKGGCPKCKAKLWRYREVQVVNAENGVSGSLDFLVDFGLGKHTMVECKTLTRDTFDTLVAPMGEHRLRVQLYLLHISRMTGAHAGKIDSEQGKVLYISKGFGVKNEAFGGKIMPFKEFWVKRNDKEALAYYDRAAPLHQYRTAGGPMPEGVCASAMDKRGKHCPVLLECFSGTY